MFKESDQIEKFEPKGLNMINKILSKGKNK